MAKKPPPQTTIGTFELSLAVNDIWGSPEGVGVVLHRLIRLNETPVPNVITIHGLEEREDFEEPHESIADAPEYLTAADARKLAELLIAAADRADASAEPAQAEG